MQRIIKRLVTLATVSALALGSLFAAPASALSARDENTLRVIMGLAAIGIIASELDDEDRDRSRNRNGYWYDDHRDGRYNSTRLIPSQCVIQIRTRQGSSDVVSEQCYQANRRAALPNACEMRLRTDRGSRDVYGMNCLRDRGYRIVSSNYGSGNRNSGGYRPGSHYGSGNYSGRSHY